MFDLRVKLGRGGEEGAKGMEVKFISENLITVIEIRLDINTVWMEHNLDYDLHQVLLRYHVPLQLTTCSSILW